MVWQSYDKQNIIILDEPMAEQLSQYLENKESQLSASILGIILQIEGQSSLKETYAPSFFRLSEAVEDFGRKISRASLSSSPTLIKDKWKYAAKEINQAMWNYVEVLEGCVTELFQQIDQMGFEQWNIDMVRATTSIKDELTHRMDDLVWAIRRLEQQLKSYQRYCDIQEKKWGVGIRRIFFFFTSLLDRSLEPAVRKCNKFLNFRYRKFIEQYTGYLQLYETAHQSMSKFYYSRALSSMDINQQDKIKELSFLLNLWENNCKARALQRTEPVRALRSCVSFDWAISLFKEYYHTIREALFDKSRMIKKQLKMDGDDEEIRKSLIDSIAGYRKELAGLKELIDGYIRFHEQTDPGAGSWFRRLFTNFSEKQMPKQFYEMKKLNHDIKGLDGIALNFQTILEKDQRPNYESISYWKNEVNRHLHEMGQPLASKDLMRRDGKALVQSLQNLNEIASFDPKIVSFVCRTLCKATCADWKYHVLQEIPLFHKVYEVHEGIAGVKDERFHLNRLNKFQRILNQLETWIINNETLKHAQGIDLDINDIKAYLQDFLAYVQRLEADRDEDGDTEEFERPVGRAAQALLQYLYLFGNFFAKLRPDNAEHRLMRKQLLFIDQYFEAIDRRIQELMRVS